MILLRLLGCTCSQANYCHSEHMELGVWPVGEGSVACDGCQVSMVWLSAERTPSTPTLFTCRTGIETPGKFSSLVLHANQIQSCGAGWVAQGKGCRVVMHPSCAGLAAISEGNCEVDLILRRELGDSGQGLPCGDAPIMRRTGGNSRG